MAFSIAVSATVQTAPPTSGTSATSLKPAGRTFSLTGALGTAIVKGDVVALWGSNDGGATFQPLRQSNNAPVQLNYYNPEVVIDDACDHYGTRRVSVGAGSTLAAVGLNGEAAQNPLVQSGTVTLATGTATVSGKILTAQSIIVPVVITSGGTMTAFANLDVTVNLGAQTFTLTAKNDANVTLALATPVVNYVIVG